MSRLRPRERARLVLVASILVTGLLYAVPYGHVLAYPLLLLSTVAHELGHGVAALLTGGSFQRLEMWPDGSGVALTAVSDSRLSQAVVAAGGLLGPAVLAALGFACGRTPRGARHALTAFAVLLTLALILVVRNPFGWLFVGTIALLCWLIARRASAELAQLGLIFLAVQLALSVFSRGDYLFTPVARTATGTMPSDVGQIAQALLLPYWFWGALCGLASAAVLAYGLRTYWR
ncbi:MAG: M50 family peptidase [Acidobacteria bacterium]|nr:MAG: M50 family peptidase [Acidobacteriota bacterium]